MAVSGVCYNSCRAAGLLSCTLTSNNGCEQYCRQQAWEQCQPGWFFVGPNWAGVENYPISRLPDNTMCFDGTDRRSCVSGVCNGPVQARAFTEAPSLSPTLYPSVSPTFSPQSPTQSPLPNGATHTPTKFPTTSPSSSPLSPTRLCSPRSTLVWPLRRPLQMHPRTLRSAVCSSLWNKGVLVRIPCV